MSGQVPDAVSAVRVYWRPGCPYCAVLRRGIKRSGLPVEWHNIWDDPAAAATVRSATGGDETVPTVEVAGRLIVNPSIRQVQSVVRVRAPHLVPTGTTGSSGRKRRWPWRRR